MKQIELTQGQVALVDDDDFERVTAAGPWCAYKCANKQGDAFYAAKWPSVQLHRLIMDAPDGVEVDHKDGNGLNCQRANLRLATRSQNQWNRGKQANNTSGYKGVYWHKQRDKWHAQIAVNGKRVHLGYFATAEAAAAAYDNAARELHGAFARTNGVAA